MKQKRSPLFDIWKGIAILMVCITHFSWKDDQRLDLLFPFWISMAVPIFMIVMGYLTAASWDRKGCQLRDLYGFDNLKAKLVQYLRPFAAFFAAELLLEPLVHGKFISFSDGLSAFLSGGLGKFGTYYVPILVQMLFLFPLIYALLRNNVRNISLLFAVNLLYELCKDSLGIEKADYRLLAFRYIFLISMGCWLYFKRDHLSPIGQVLMLAFGVLYVYGISYTNYRPAIFTRWNTTSMMTAFYALPIVAFSLKFGRKLHCAFLEHLGRASYFIFLFQMIYYNYLKTLIPIETRWLKLAVGVSICLAGGYGFYLLDNRVCAAVKKHRAAQAGSAVPGKLKSPSHVSA